MTRIYVKQGSLPLGSYMWDDGNTYVAHQTGEADPPPGLVIWMVEQGRLSKEHLPDDVDPNQIAVAETLRVAEGGDGGGGSESIGGDEVPGLDGGDGDDGEDLDEATVAVVAETERLAATEDEPTGSVTYTENDEMPEGFPGRDELLGAGYSTIGAVTKIDLTAVSGIGRATKEKILAWVEENVQK